MIKTPAPLRVNIDSHPSGILIHIATERLFSSLESAHFEESHPAPLICAHTAPEIRFWPTYIIHVGIRGIWGYLSPQRPAPSPASAVAGGAGLDHDQRQQDSDCLQAGLGLRAGQCEDPERRDAIRRAAIDRTDNTDSQSDRHRPTI